MEDCLKRRIPFWLAIAAATMVGTFAVPFLFPLKIPVFSPVYTAGGNNRIGALVAAAVSVAATLLCWRWRLFPQQPRQHAAQGNSMDRRLLWAAAGVVSLYAAVLGTLMVRNGMYYADAGYFLTQLRSGMVFHARLYRDVEFAYGPLLYLWPALFVRGLGLLHVSAGAAYVVSLCAMEAVGTAMLFYTVNAMPMRRAVKAAAFLTLSVVTLDPQEGLNYTAFRFVCSLAALVLLSRQRTPWRAAAVAALAAFLTFAISPEMGVAFLAGAVVYSGYRAWTGSRAMLAIVPAALGGAGVFSVLVGRDYFATLKEFANGGYNMLLEPAPHIYLLLVCAVGLAPAVAAAALAEGRHARARASGNGLLLGTYMAGLALLPAALGRCDPLHIAFNGWPVFLLSFVLLDSVRLRVRRVGLAVGLLFAGYSVAQEYALGSGWVKYLLLQRPHPYDDVALPRLQAVLQGSRVSFPWYSPMHNVDVLAAAGEYQPLYLCIPAVDDRAESRTVREMRLGQYAMAPRWYPLAGQNAINNDGLKFRLRFGYRYQQRYAPHLQGLLLKQELEKNWQRVGTFGSYDLYRKER